MDPATDKKVEPMSYVELAEKYLALETENARLREALHKSHLATIGLRKKVEDISLTILTALTQQEEA